MKHGRSRGKKTTYCYAAHTKKVRFKTFADAKIARASRLEHGQDYLRIYPCSHCKGWHLTSQEQRALELLQV